MSRSILSAVSLTGRATTITGFSMRAADRLLSQWARPQAGREASPRQMQLPDHPYTP
jgi:hypothetical protein